jgi:hypothetical protein
MAVERKYERDIDLLLAEEFSVNPEFAAWFGCKTGLGDEGARVVDIFVSKSDDLGESDLIVLYEQSEGARFALMIEDKVDAPLQPMQAHRYRLRAEREIQQGFCTKFEVWLVAPEYYLSRCTTLSDFDGSISLEDIAAFLRRGEPSNRLQYRAAFLETAAVRRSNNWVRREDEATNEFWSAAYDLASRKFPILEMKPLSVTKDSTWINFRPSDMPTQPKRIYVSFKGDRGQMDLTFSNVQAHRFSELVARFLDPDMTIHQTQASTAIRLKVEGFRIDEGLDVALLRAEKAFEVSERLIRFYRQHRSALDEAAQRAHMTSTRLRGR